MQPLLILSPLLGTPKNAGVTEQFHAILAPEKAEVMQPLQPLLSLSLFLGTPENAGVM